MVKDSGGTISGKQCKEKCWFLGQIKTEIFKVSNEVSLYRRLRVGGIVNLSALTHVPVIYLLLGDLIYVNIVTTALAWCWAYPCFI